MTRPIHEIGREIETAWTNPFFAAVPYIHAMRELNTPADRFGKESADSIIRYFLVNAGTWRGEPARRIKAELKQIIGDKPWKTGNRF